MKLTYFNDTLTIEWEITKVGDNILDLADIRGFGSDGQVYIATGVLNEGKIIGVLSETIEIDC